VGIGIVEGGGETKLFTATVSNWMKLMLPKPAAVRGDVNGLLWVEPRASIIRVSKVVCPPPVSVWVMPARKLVLTVLLALSVLRVRDSVVPWFKVTTPTVVRKTCVPDTV